MNEAAETPSPATPGTATAATPAAGTTDAGTGAADTVRRRRRRRLVLLALAALLVFDLVRPPADQLSARFLLAGIDLYQATLSRRFGALGVRCRFQPTCSHYAEGALREDGAVVGSARAAWRIARCGPWTPQGTVDPP